MRFVDETNKQAARLNEKKELAHAMGDSPTRGGVADGEAEWYLNLSS